jgi:phosphoribosylaminoimidazolecarboxamide formyltransferase/IMP cyclohydrolase
MSGAADVTFPRGSETLRGHLCRAQPDAERGAIVLIPDVYGLSPLYREISARFADRGFTTLAIDLYTREGTPTLSGPAEAMRWIAGLSDVRVLGDLQSAIDFLAAPGRRIGITGFCMGGQYALMAACTSAIDAATRLYFAQKAFRHTGRYEAAIAAYFAQVEVRDGRFVPAESDETFPYRLNLGFEKVQDLRYGENPHQRAAFYSDLGSTLYSVAAARQLQGKELSFNNILDLDSAWRLVTELDEPACVIVKHTNPCGTGLGAGPLEAYERAWAGDPTSAFGGVIAFNVKLDAAAARALGERFVEAVIAPGVEAEALKALAKKTNLRVMSMDTTGLHKLSGFDLRRVVGGLLAQQWDQHRLERERGEAVTKRKPTDAEWKALLLAWTVAKHVKSNAIVFANEHQTVGVGAGQMSRVDSTRIAAQKAVLPLAGTAVGSDAFFPFRDGIDEIAKAGAVAIIQPGGSVRDEETIAAADEHELAMVFTGVRHFKH